MIAHDVLGLKRKIDAGERSRTALSPQLISGPSGGSVPAYRDLFQLSQNEGVARWNAGERSMAVRFLMHFLKPNEGKDSWYAFMGNEVAHSSPFLANWFEPHLTQNAARRISLFGFRNTPGGLFGNDDLGATSAWYIWTAMGIYPVIPGVGGVTVVAPSFGHVEISVPGGKSVQAAFEQREGARMPIFSLCERDSRETSSLWLTASELFARREAGFPSWFVQEHVGSGCFRQLLPLTGIPSPKRRTVYRSIWREEGDDRHRRVLALGVRRRAGIRRGVSSSEPDGSKVLEVDFTSVYTASGLLLRHADVGRASTFDGSETVSVAVKGSDGQEWTQRLERCCDDQDGSRYAPHAFGFWCSREGDTRSSFDLRRSGRERGTWHLRSIGGRRQC